MLIFRIFAVIMLVVLTACAESPAKTSVTKEALTPIKLGEVREKTQQNDLKTSINPDVLFMLMTAEIAGQRGQYGVAFEGYLEAAKRTHEPKFAEKAAVIAMYIKDSKKTNEAVVLWLRQDSKNVSARKMAALLALRSGNKKAALEHLNVLFTVDPVNFENDLLELASVLQKDGKIKVLDDTLDTLSVQHSDQAVIYLMQSLLAMQKKDKNLAEAKIQKALQLKPDWDRALIFQAQIAVFSGEMKTGKLLLQDAAAKNPNNSKINKMLAQVLIKLEEYKEAATVYQAVIAADPKDIESQFALGLVYLQLDKDDLAEEVFKRLLEQADWQYQASFYLGKLEEKREHTQQALVWFDKVIQGPLVFDASISAISILAKDKQFNEAGSRLSQLSATFPKQKPRLILMQAELYSQQKQYQQAFDLLTEALVSYPSQKELLYTRALLAERVNKPEIVETDLQKILAMEPDNIEALNALGYTLVGRSGRYADAEKYLSQALKLEPESAVIIDSYGWLQFKLGNTEKALEYLQQAYKKQPENEIAAHLAEVLWVLGRKDEAKAVFNKAFKSASDDEYLLDFQRRILKDSN